MEQSNKWCLSIIFENNNMIKNIIMKNKVTATIFRRFTEANIFRTQEFKNKSFRTNLKFDGNLNEDTSYQIVIQNNQQALQFMKYNH